MILYLCLLSFAVSDDDVTAILSKYKEKIAAIQQHKHASFLQSDPAIEDIKNESKRWLDFIKKDLLLSPSASNKKTVFLENAPRKSLSEVSTELDSLHKKLKDQQREFEDDLKHEEKSVPMSLNLDPLVRNEIDSIHQKFSEELEQMKESPSFLQSHEQSTLDALDRAKQSLLSLDNDIHNEEGVLKNANARDEKILSWQPPSFLQGKSAVEGSNFLKVDNSLLNREEDELNAINRKIAEERNELDRESRAQNDQLQKYASFIQRDSIDSSEANLAKSREQFDNIMNKIDQQNELLEKELKSNI